MNLFFVTLAAMILTTTAHADQPARQAPAKEESPRR